MAAAGYKCGMPYLACGAGKAVRMMFGDGFLLRHGRGGKSDTTTWEVRAAPLHLRDDRCLMHASCGSVACAFTWD